MLHEAAWHSTLPVLLVTLRRGHLLGDEAKDNDPARARDVLARIRLRFAIEAEAKAQGEATSLVRQHAHALLTSAIYCPMPGHRPVRTRDWACRAAAFRKDGKRDQ